LCRAQLKHKSAKDFLIRLWRKKISVWAGITSGRNAGGFLFLTDVILPGAFFASIIAIFIPALAQAQENTGLLF
jgi:hypothetical protein